MGMETVTSLLEIACALLMSTLIANGLAYQLTEVWRPPFKRKPFTCFGCMAFWLTFFFGLVLGILSRQNFDCAETRTVVTAGVAALSFLLGLLSFLNVKIKYRIYE